eukprot:Em0005g1168a
MASRHGMGDATVRKFLLKDVVVTGRELGAGYYSKVLELQYLGTKCAGKKLHKELYKHKSSPAVLERFGTECKLLSELRHPHIVQFLGLHQERDSDVPLLVMEYLPSALSDCIEQYGIMPEEVCYSILHDVAVGMNFLHNRSPPIIHRDLTANNVLLTSSMCAKISDLGMAKILDLAPAHRAEKMTACPGTVSYMPPEAMVSSPVYDTKLDCFSYGVLMLHIFSGLWPIPKEYLQPDPSHPNRFCPLTEIQRREQYIKQLGSEHPFLTLIKQCLSNVSSDRPTMTKILSELRNVLAHFPSSFPNRVEMLRQITHDAEEKQKILTENEKLCQVVASHEVELKKLKLTCTIELEVVKEQLVQLQLGSEALAAENNELKMCNANLQRSLSKKEDELRVFQEKINMLTEELSMLQKTLQQKALENSQKLKELQNLIISKGEERKVVLDKLTAGNLGISLSQLQDPQSSCISLCKRFEDLFLNSADDMAECIERCTSLNHMDAQYLMCDLVQISYEQCEETVIKILQQQLAKLFQFDVTRTADLHDVKLAFGLLMKASAAEGSIPHLDVSKQVLGTFLEKYSTVATSNEHAISLQEHLSHVSKLSWKFTTCIPPLVLCRPAQFQEEWQDREFQYWNKALRQFKLKVSIALQQGNTASVLGTSNIELFICHS